MGLYYMHKDSELFNISSLVQRPTMVAYHRELSSILCSNKTYHPISKQKVGKDNTIVPQLGFLNY